MGGFAEARFGVAHGGGVIAIHRTEVALAVDQHQAHAEGLGHAHEGVVDGAVAMRVVFTHHVTHDTGRFLIGLVIVDAQFEHTEQDAAMHRLQAVAHIGDGARDDDAHCVIEIGFAHFLFDGDREDFSGVAGHDLPLGF